MLQRQMRISQGHLIIAVTGKLLHHVRVDTGHDQLGGEGVAEVVPAKPLNPRVREDAGLGLADVVERRHGRSRYAGINGRLNWSFYAALF